MPLFGRQAQNQMGGKKESAAERGFWLVLFSPSWKVQFTHRSVYF